MSQDLNELFSKLHEQYALDESDNGEPITLQGKLLKAFAILEYEAYNNGNCNILVNTNVAFPSPYVNESDAFEECFEFRKDYADCLKLLEKHLPDSLIEINNMADVMDKGHDYLRDLTDKDFLAYKKVKKAVFNKVNELIVNS